MTNDKQQSGFGKHKQTLEGLLLKSLTMLPSIDSTAIVNANKQIGKHILKEQQNVPIISDIRISSRCSRTLQRDALHEPFLDKYVLIRIRSNANYLLHSKGTHYDQKIPPVGILIFQNFINLIHDYILNMRALPPFLQKLYETDVTSISYNFHICICNTVHRKMKSLHRHQ